MQLHHFQALLKTEENVRLNYKYIYEILATFADAEFQVDVQQEKKPSKPPKTKDEFLACIQYFLISDSNLRKVFLKFGALHGNQD